MSTPERTAQPPLTDMDNWPSYAYWHESKDRIKQFWYVSFCLMMSSIQDRLTGLALQESGNLNWATTAFYYSGVHAGRLVCFVCSGDYPTGHAELANLLAPTPAPRTTRPPRCFHFDWLDKFQRYVRVNRSSGGAQESQAARPDREALVAAIDANLPGVRVAFDQFAPLLAKFKNLRNDCNYEALLVAHERNHAIVTGGFEDLVASAKCASGLAVGLAVTVYSEHLRSAACFNSERDQFHAAHTHYLSGRFEQSLTRKFQKSLAATDELQRIKDRLDWPGTPASIDVEAFLEPIMYATFEGKQALMQRWLNDVCVLKDTLPAPE